MTLILTVGIAVLDDIYTIPVALRPGEKHRSTAMASVLGGSATNAALAITRLGGEARLITRIGDDAAGDTLRQMLEANGVDLSLSTPCAGMRTSRSAIILEPGGDRTIINDLDPALPDAPVWLISALPAGTDAVLSDVRWESAARRLFEAARRAGKPAILDGDRAPGDRGLLDLATHCVFSAQGLRELAGIDDLAAALLAFAAGRPGYFAVTDGARGVFSYENGKIARYPAFRVTPVDTLGAGDVWHGAFALAIGRGETIADAIRFASAAAAIKCTRPGGGMGTPNAAELATFLQENPA